MYVCMYECVFCMSMVQSSCGEPEVWKSACVWSKQGQSIRTWLSYVLAGEDIAQHIGGHSNLGVMPIHAWEKLKCAFAQES